MSKDSDLTGEKRQKKMKAAIWTIGIVVIGAVFLLLAKMVSKPAPNTPNTTNGQASAELIKKLTSLPESVILAAGQGTANPLPTPIKDAPALTKDGKPKVFFAGAEYCPYCAAERWPMVQALLRFGTFEKLGTSHSSTTDVFADTKTFSFYGSTYTSQYLVFEAIELQSNQMQGTKYATLETPNAEQKSLIDTYNAPPYVPKTSAGAIPFIDFGNKFLISGSTFSPSVLANKSLDEIADALADPNSEIFKGVIGSANAITATVCTLTGNQPANVCSNSMIQDLQAKISAQ